MTTKSYSQRKRNATPDGDSASPPKEGAASGSQSMKWFLPVWYGWGIALMLFCWFTWETMPAMLIWAVLTWGKPEWRNAE